MGSASMKVSTVRGVRLIAGLTAILLMGASGVAAEALKPRTRDLEIPFFYGIQGKWNSINLHR